MLTFVDEKTIVFFSHFFSRFLFCKADLIIKR